MKSEAAYGIIVVFGCLPAMALVSPSAHAAAPHFRIEKRPNQLDVFAGDAPLATYVFRDERIPRPYFKHVHVPGGVRVTRNQPPIEGEDLTDHPTFHPGIWMAFGDLDGADFWRNRARIRHVEFLDEPRGGDNATLSVRNVYEDGKRIVCTEECTVEFEAWNSGCLITWDSTFRPAGGEFYFGDQEEMGLGIRLASSLAEVNGGRITNSDGLKTAERAWGQQADWCRYEGVLGGQTVGVVLMPDPRNFRRCWFHARDYGLLLANPFGRKAYTGGEPSRVRIKPGETLRLRFGILIYGGAETAAIDVPAVYREFTRAQDSHQTR